MTTEVDTINEEKTDDKMSKENSPYSCNSCKLKVSSFEALKIHNKIVHS